MKQKANDNWAAYGALQQQKQDFLQTCAFEREPIIKLFLAEAAIELGSAQKWRESSGARQGAKLCGAGDS